VDDRLTGVLALTHLRTGWTPSETEWPRMSDILMHQCGAPMDPAGERPACLHPMRRLIADCQPLSAVLAAMIGASGRRVPSEFKRRERVR